MGVENEELIAAVKEANPSALRPLLAAVTERFGAASVSMALAMAGGESEAANPFLTGRMKASKMPPSLRPAPLWYGMYPGRVALLIGETGAGKSSLLLNIAVHAARGASLWGFEFPRSLRVLYVDPENSGNYRDAEPDGGLCAAKMERTEQEKPDNLEFHDGRNVNLSTAAHMAALREIICDEKFDIVILDPIANLFNTEDENSNAEAARQGKALTALSRETGACVVVAHHTGKDTQGNYGRGASARLGAADTGIVFRARGSGEENDDTYTGATRQRDDVCRLQIVKDRPNFFGPSSKYLRMAGNDRFDLDTFDSWRGLAKEGRIPKTNQATEEISIFMQDGMERSRAVLLKLLENEGIGRATADASLKFLTENNTLTMRTAAHNEKFFQIVRETGEV